MPKDKKYYFLKIPENFFTDVKIKFLRRQSDGDHLLAVYLEILCISLQRSGAVYYDNLMTSLEEDIALAIDESVEDVQRTITHCCKAGLLEDRTEESGKRYIAVPDIENILVTDTDSARRKREQREREKATNESAENPFAEYMTT